MSLRSRSVFDRADARGMSGPSPPLVRIGMSTRPYRHILETLHRAGLRPTRQRLALARLLFDGRDRHITAEQLHGEAVSQRVSVSLATVYNTLHQFTAAGLLREVVVDPGRSYFDTNISDHHHFYNEKTGDLQDIAELVVANLPDPPQGAKIARVDVVVRLAEED